MPAPMTKPITPSDRPRSVSAIARNTPTAPTAVARRNAAAEIKRWPLTARGYLTTTGHGAAVAVRETYCDEVINAIRCVHENGHVPAAGSADRRARSGSANAPGVEVGGSARS